MNDEKEIAQTIMEAQKKREKSYTYLNDPYGEYKLTIEECLIEVGKQHNLSPNLWRLLSLTMHWWNDIQLWAEDVLAGKDIPTELKKNKKKKTKNGKKSTI